MNKNPFVIFDAIFIIQFVKKNRGKGRNFFLQHVTFEYLPNRY